MSAAWSPLPGGEFTGIHWSAPGAIDGQDPYLAWAEADRFAGYRVAPKGKPPKWLPIVIELTPGASVPALVQASNVKWLQIPRVYLNLPGLRFCTAHAKPRFFERLRSDPLLRSLIQRFELGLPVGHHTQPIHDPCTPGSHPVVVPDRLSGQVLGLIDGGLAFANQAFLNARGRTRVKHFWRQDDTQDGNWTGNEPHHQTPLDPARAGPRPHDMGYGHELSGAAINAAMVTYTRGGRLDEDALYQHLQLRDLGKPVNHGTHVMSLACGKGNLLNPQDDEASRCVLIAVQLDWANVLDTSGGAMNVSVLDALMYILARCTPQARLVVNISWGTLAGPHDGSSILEAAMDQLIDLGEGRLQVTVPAGNAYQSRTHANATLAPGASLPLHWRLQPDDRTQSFLEIWIPCGAQGMAISVTPPGHAQPLPPLHKGQSGLWVDAAGRPLCGLVFPNDSALGTGSTCALLALAPTFSHNRKAVTAPFGSWQVTLTNSGTEPVVFDACVERDDVALGQNTGARQSYLEDAWYDTSGNIGSFVDHPDNPTPIRRSGTFNSLSTGQNTVSVGGTRQQASPGAHFALYSPRKPDPDASRPQRAGVKKVPDTLAPSDDNPALWGVLGAGSLSGSVVRLAGTSSAAPLEARRLINRT
ncbi:MAG: S8 family serine peptidase [Hydrogenophaga sp.]|uniref:S8 family serine peptidase n=1 Tax=Hydrogenophaga sp. TaxID=1904254 RepID=UPI00262F69B5|nr:S8 family serine peptidase [Hydrogenophaga sp.]MDM7941284.1 S8 family serine peptidase [Hydrogenophaga sp.]